MHDTLRGIAFAWDLSDSGGARSRKTERKTVLHWGQRKLILAEIEFLTRYYEKATCVVYAGAAPGTHIAFLAKMFPKLHFELIDGRPFSRKLEVDAKELKDEQGKQRTPLTSKDDEFHPSQAVIEEDMKLQMSWHLLMKPLASSFKFRLPWGAGRTHYLNGTIFLPVWGPETTTESRLFVESGGSEAECLKTYDNETFGDKAIFEYWEAFT
eukprot:g9653.t1